MSTQNQKTILLVEDEALFSLAGKKTLQKYGYKVITVPTGEQAIEKMRATPGIDLILMDINLGKGRMDGTEAAEIILKDHDIPVVFLSSHTEKDVVEKTEKITSYGYVVKNSGITVLDASIKMAFKLHEAHQRLKDREEALKESEERLKNLYQESPIPTFTWQKKEGDFILIDFNRAAIQITNGKVGDRLGDSAEELYKNRPQILNDMNLCFQERSVVRREITSRHFAPGRFLSVHYGFIPPDLIIVHTEDQTEHKLAEDALQESEEKYRSIFDNAVMGIFRTTPDGHYLSINPAGAKMYAYKSPEEMTQLVTDMGHQIYVHPEDRKRLKELVENDGFVEGFEAEHYTKDGSTIWVSMNSRVIRDNSGTILYYETTSRNITSRKRNEQALQESEQKYRSIFENAIEGIFQTTPEGQFLSVNPALAKLFKYDSPQEFMEQITDIGRQHYANPKDRETYKNTLERDGVIKGFETQLLNKVGNTVWASLNARAVRNDEGTIICYEGTVEDITSRKHAEEEILREREKLKTLSDNAPFGMVLINKEGHFTYINTRFTDLFGFDISDIPDGRTWFRRAYPDIEYMHTVISTWSEDFGDAMPGERKPRVFTVTCKDGTRKIVQFIASMLISGDYLMTCEDTTGLRQLESQLRQAQKTEAIGTLAGGIAHDFNNILTALMGYATLMQMKMDKDSPLQSYVDQILLSSRKAADLTQSLLAFSRQQTVTLAPLDINNTIKETKKLLKRLLTEDIELHTSLTQDDMIVMADKAQMDQILFNLVANARDAMPKGGKLAIETDITTIDNEFIRMHGYGESGKYVLLSVTDTGTGMDEATKARIFDPFFTTKEVGKGTGLGLATVYGIVKQHNGYITVDSKPNQGTTFRIYLPAAMAKVDKEQQETAPAILMGKERILIAEDNEEVRRFMREALQQYGYKIIEAIDGEDAVGKFKQHLDIDLIVVDSVMPKKNGREVYEEIHGINPHIKTLFMSGHTKDIVLNKGIKDKEFNFIAKPLSLNALLQKVREVLDR